MKACVVGAGAIGGILAARLAHAGHEVSAIARGAHLQAIQERGLTLKWAGEQFTVDIRATSDASDMEPQDYVILTVKAPALPGIAPSLMPLLGPQTTIVTAMNGVPWWFCHALTGPLAGRTLSSTDPNGLLGETLTRDRLLGCVVHAGASVPEPGVVDHAAGNQFIVGDAGRHLSAPASVLAEALTNAGLNGRTSDDIHGEIWMKLIGNMGMGPICALTGATLVGLARDADVRPIAAAMMQEAMNVGNALGLPMDMSVEARIDLGAELGEFKPSILQDLERDRPLEIDAMVTVVSEMGEIAGVQTPTIDTVLALLRGRARRAGLY
ncbi:MAG: 2-dehydropantoate 2-reductase [Rhodospirillaceae bacterium]|nr:2-dehydropantoate 2-reductase [Rhodospirillaceae bacterium]MBT4773715.1 2-dehydropantoate 2-reductase [Rhodospirillaceae bacterium]MBT5357629.1 2-dehydropantoate 2-reductase [Rhodospirillaceae bacterium]MBT5770618.1 2-dehydropantoate 2-reductase [Rhodospirillaceae bacterium]MBT6308611.1 2-dehydropantoate 2-reductase [Rhodospirillaceae bacterium]